MHPNPAVREQLREPLDGRENVLLTEPLGYAGFARLLDRCDLVITDSGGIQEEAPSLGKPVLVTRETTERAEGVAAGTLLLVGTDADRIAHEGDRLLTDDEAYARMADAHNPYGDGRAAERIVEALEHIVRGSEAPAPFGHGYTRRAVIRAAGVNVPLGPIEALEDRLFEHPRGRLGRRTVAGLIWPFEGLPGAIEVFFAITLAVIVVLFAWTFTLLIRGLRAARRAPAASDPDGFTGSSSSRR